MAKLAQPATKYTIRAKLEADGVVEKPDVIGAIFGQTEGLLGVDLDLRDLQKTGRIGRISVMVKAEKGKSSAKISIPSSLGASETALIAAALETIDRVGPCTAKIKIEKVENNMAKKREYLIERAKDILGNLFERGPETKEIAESVKDAVRTSEISEWEGLPVGPAFDKYDSIILCEGRADVINLLRNGIRNVIGIKGTNIPDKIIKLTKEKTTTVFLDGDRGGDLILRELIQKGADIDYIARAPEGKEVEELTKKEVYTSLREKTPTTQPPAHPEDKFKDAASKIVGTSLAFLYDENMQILGKVPANKILASLHGVEGAKFLIIDGPITQKHVSLAEKKGIEKIFGTRKIGVIRKKKIIVLTKADIK
jgi:DNA primase